MCGDMLNAAFTPGGIGVAAGSVADGGLALHDGGSCMSTCGEACLVGSGAAPGNGGNGASIGDSVAHVGPCAMACVADATSCKVFLNGDNGPSLDGLTRGCGTAPGTRHMSGMPCAPLGPALSLITDAADRDVGGLPCLSPGETARGATRVAPHELCWSGLMHKHHLVD